MAVFQISRRNVPLDMVDFWALKVLVFKFLGSNMVLRIKENGFKPKTAFLNFDFSTPLGAVCPESYFKIRLCSYFLVRFLCNSYRIILP